MNVYRVKTGSILPLGKQGENLARKIQFDLTRWISTFGPGTVQLLHQRSGDEAPYPVAVEQEGNLAVWTVTSADTAAAGTGRAELQYYVGDALAKSETWMTKVLPALGPASETPPEAQQGWVDQVLQAGTVATEAAKKAGYKETSCRVIAAENLSKPAISAYIKRRLDEQEAALVADSNEILKFYTAVMRGEVKDQFGMDASLSDRVKAGDSLVKRYAAASDRNRTTMEKLDSMLKEFQDAVKSETT